ncbi:MAG TPA: outer membrane beta-barrel protein [Gemmatimonadaceae bacterium]|nr:outer membrane beta-barrel protein [Gemmatimonadaceae bacterium]
MLSKIRAAATIAVLALAARPASLLAQGNAHFVIAAGATLPTGTFGDNHDIGYHGIVGVEMLQPSSQLGFRVEGMYNEFNQKSGSDKAHASGVIGNAVFELAPAGRTTANTIYAIGGIGYYSTKDPTFFDNSSQTNVGWNIGGGFRFPLTGFSAYVEARYHSVNGTDFHFVPITFGLVF